MSATWFEHAIAFAAPRMAARRVMARQAFETLTRGYDGAARGRRTEGWRAPGSSADTEIGVAGALLRDRMRDLVRNNPHAAKAVAVLVNNIIGAGIMPRAASGDDTLDRKVDALFERWTAECDADGQLDFYGLQTLICREMVEAGEVLVRRRLRRSGDGLPVPLQLQVLEADFLDATKTSAVGAGRIVQGIEFDPVGKRRAYWLHSEHPGDAHGALRGGLDSRPVPSTEIAHVYEKQRTQARGVPWGAPVIRSLRDLDDYEVAELVRKKTEACVTAIVFGDDEAQQGIAPSVVDADGNRVEQFEPGLIAYARGGKDIRFNQPSATGGYGEYKRASLHTISAGFRVPYELLTGDLSQVNYSSIRAGLVEFRRQIDAVQWQLFIPMFCAPVWRWFTEAAWAAGQIPSPNVPVEWSPPKFEAVDPQKDAMANLLSIRSGTMTLAEVIAKQGRNPDAVLAEIAATNAKLDALGLVLDSDPRRVTKTGSAQTSDPANDLSPRVTKMRFIGQSLCATNDMEKWGCSVFDWRFYTVKVVTSVIISFYAASAVSAANFDVLRLPGFENAIIIMAGEVTEGDAQRFEDVVGTLGGAHATLNVSGPGGLVNEALDIGAQVQQHHFATMVSSETECYSACALIWLAGSRRYLSPDSIIGVHAAYRTREDETQEESGVANARIGAFLNMIGLPLDAITYITTAPPNATLPITPAIARNVGIDVYEQHGMETVTPAAAPTTYFLARQTAELAAISTQCSELLQLEPAAVRQAMETTLRKAHEGFGGERMAEIVSWMPLGIRVDFERDGFLKWCFEAAPRLRSEGLSFGFEGPSFDCARASSGTEHLICDDLELWGPDRAIAALYAVHRERATPEVKTRLRDTQRSWIAWRDGCGADAACVVEAYRQRLKDFGLE